MFFHLVPCAVDSNVGQTDPRCGPERTHTPYTADGRADDLADG